MTSGSDSNADHVSNRTRVTQALLEEVEACDSEQEFLRMAAQLSQSWSPATSTLYSSKIVERALDKHAAALIKAANAADRTAASLTRATWVLAAATIVLTVVTLLGVIR